MFTSVLYAGSAVSEAADQLLEKASQAQREKRLPAARHNLQAALELLREQQDPIRLAHALRALGELERKLHDGHAAREHYEEAVSLYRKHGDPLKLAHTVRHLGDVHRDMGRADLAGPCYYEALALYRSHADTAPLDLANAIRSLALLKTEAGETTTARALWHEAHDLYATEKLDAGVAECAARLSRLAASHPDR